MTAVVRVRAVAPADDGLLTDAEHARRDRLVDPRDRAAYAAAHVLVRECAGQLLGIAAEEVPFAQRCSGCGATDHGRPFVAGRTDVGISLSHTRDHVAAMASFGACGIDLEDTFNGPVPHRALAPAERASAAVAVDPMAEFLRLWTRKEALVKAGAGTLDDLAALDVTGDVAGWILRSRREAGVTVSSAVAT